MPARTLSSKGQPTRPKAVQDMTVTVDLRELRGRLKRGGRRVVSVDEMKEAVREAGTR